MKRNERRNRGSETATDRSKVEINGNPNTTQIAVVTSILDHLFSRFSRHRRDQGSADGRTGGYHQGRIEASVTPDYLIGNSVGDETLRRTPRRSKWARSNDAIHARAGFSDAFAANRWQDKL